VPRQGERQLTGQRPVLPALDALAACLGSEAACAPAIPFLRNHVTSRVRQVKGSNDKHPEAW
jgi:hypothetical protein